jgi:threonine synthase
VKALFSDVPFNSKYRLGAVNSINWARILAQTVYYFSAYFQLRRDLNLVDGQPLSLQFVVPTGNFGDILAGYYAKKMGLPVDCKLGVATNANDILARFWKTGKYEKTDSSGEQLPESLEISHGASDGRQASQETSGVKETYSPAMDILVSSNFERLLWHLAAGSVDGDRLKAGEIVAGWMSTLKSDGRVEVPRDVLEAAREEFCAERVSDPEVCLIPHLVALQANRTLDIGYD